MDLSQEPEHYINASVTNLFFWTNNIHDIFYQYGFDEKAGNFQRNNFGRGGRDQDPVLAFAQGRLLQRSKIRVNDLNVVDYSDNNNAFFRTTPDGVAPEIHMHLFTMTKPKRDGDMEPGIIMHEYAHGISTRLTGGPLNMNCLHNEEGHGMGEGWGDAFATMLRMRPNYTSDMNFGMGEYAAGSGIRPYLYSRDMKVNPQIYSYIHKPGYGRYQHAVGSVWATILYEVYWEVVNEFGFESDWYKVREYSSSRNPDIPGNLVMMQLLVDGMKMQPCRPTFVDARNAIVDADLVNFDGKHTCALWRGFSKRGLGLDAKAGGKDGFQMPDECQ